MSKKNIDVIKAIFTAWAILLLIFTFLVVVVLAKDSISFRINIDKRELKYGESITLNYKISNLWPRNINNLSVKTEIYANDNPQQKYYSQPEDYGQVKFFDKISGTYTRTLYVPVGEYTIISNMTYLNKSKELQSKDLSLQFKVIP